jgi:Oxidoreductase FAD-binding domain
VFVAVARDERGFILAGPDVREETARAKTIVLDVPGWAGHVAGPNVDGRLTAEDGYQAERSYAIASAPESAKVAFTVERIDDGEVSSHLTGALCVADELELRGPIGGPFTWRVDDGGPLLPVADGSGLVPLMASRARSTRACSSPHAPPLKCSIAASSCGWRQATGSPYVTRSRAIHPPRGGGRPAAVYLTSDDADYIHANALHIDGGRVAV